MDAPSYWNLFLDSGLPEYYLMYSRAKAMEESHVFEHKGFGASGNALQ